jgi:Domain of unknown function (DUF5615)
MKLLLDEHLPHGLRSEIAGHDVFTVAFMGWSGIENGELLLKAASEAFDAVITNDRGLEYEQNLAALPVAVVFLNAEANTLETLRPLVPALLHALQNLHPGQFVRLVP